MGLGGAQWRRAVALEMPGLSPLSLTGQLAPSAVLSSRGFQDAPAAAAATTSRLWIRDHTKGSTPPRLGNLSLSLFRRYPFSSPRVPSWQEYYIHLLAFAPTLLINIAVCPFSYILTLLPAPAARVGDRYRPDAIAR